jgi:hypothetical protein
MTSEICVITARLVPIGRQTANYVLALPPDRAELCNRWRTPLGSYFAAVSRHVHLALFYDAQLDIGAMGT